MTALGQCLTIHWGYREWVHMKELQMGRGVSNDQVHADIMQTEEADR